MQMLLDGRHHILERMQQYQEEIAKKKNMGYLLS